MILGCVNLTRKANKGSQQSLGTQKMNGIENKVPIKNLHKNNFY